MSARSTKVFSLLQEKDERLLELGHHCSRNVQLFLKSALYGQRKWLAFPKRGKPTTTSMHCSWCLSRPHPLFSTQSWYEYSETTLWLLLWEGHGWFLMNLHPADSQREPTGPTQPVKMCAHNILHHVSTCLMNETEPNNASVYTTIVHLSSSRLHLHALQVLFAAFQLVQKNLFILAW